MGIYLLLCLQLSVMFVFCIGQISLFILFSFILPTFLEIVLRHSEANHIASH